MFEHRFHNLHDYAYVQRLFYILPISKLLQKDVFRTSLSIVRVCLRKHKHCEDDSGNLKTLSGKVRKNRFLFFFRGMYCPFYFPFLNEM